MATKSKGIQKGIVTSTSIFDTILAEGIRAGQVPARTQAAREWFRNKARGVPRTNNKEIMKDASRHHVSHEIENAAQKTLMPGSCYLFNYNAKLKATLPYWDAFPMIFPFRLVEGGFYGINLHYLDYRMRARLMDALYNLTNNDRYDDTTKLNISWKLLQASSANKFIAPCVKHYLYPQVRSKFLYISPAEWDLAFFMPIQRMQKASQNKVWEDSNNKILGIK